MNEINPELKAYIEKNILPLYESHDAAHGPEHVRTVISNSFDLARGLTVDADMVYTIAAYHDVGLRFGREDHEQTSGKWLYEDEALSRWFTKEQRQVMREAVEDHRASRKEPPRSLYGRIVSEADRDIDPMRIVRRCMEFGRAQMPDADAEALIRRAMDHIEEKYGEHGYLRLWLPCPRNQAGLNTLRAWLQSGEIRNICEQFLELAPRND